MLVVLIVLVVPELLTGPRQPASPTSPARADGAPMRSYTIELGERSAARPAQPLANRVAPAPETAAETAAESQTRAPASAPSTSAPAPPAAPVRANEPAARGPDEAPARRTTEAAPASGWSVQVGSFANRQNADRLTGELRRLGYRSFIAEGTSRAGKLYRVRIGPEADRAAVEALAERVAADERLARDIRKGSIVPHP